MTGTALFVFVPLLLLPLGAWTEARLFARQNKKVRP